jgi:hypothetical protein
VNGSPATAESELSADTSSSMNRSPARMLYGLLSSGCPAAAVVGSSENDGKKHKWINPCKSLSCRFGIAPSAVLLCRKAARV